MNVYLKNDIDKVNFGLEFIEGKFIKEKYIGEKASETQNI